MLRIIQPITDSPMAVQLIATYQDWTWVVIQVNGPSSVWIAREQSTLQNPGIGGLQPGLRITSAMGNGFVSTWWLGQLWMCADAQTLVNIEDFQGAPKRS